MLDITSVPVRNPNIIGRMTDERRSSHDDRMTGGSDRFRTGDDSPPEAALEIPVVTAMTTAR